MGVPKIRAIATSLALVGAATLTADATAAPAQSAARTPPVAVSISNTRVVTMPTTIQPGVNTFKVTTANKRGSASSWCRRQRGTRAADAARDIEKGLDGGNVKAIKRFEANVTLLGGMSVNKGKTGKLVVDLARGLLGAGHQHQRSGEVLRVHGSGGRHGQRRARGGGDPQGRAGHEVGGQAGVDPEQGPGDVQEHGVQQPLHRDGQAQEGQDLQGLQEVVRRRPAGPPGPSPVNFGLGIDSGVVSPGHSATFRYNVPEGDYVMLCFWPDASMGGMPHAFMGMHRVITLK